MDIRYKSLISLIGILASGLFFPGCTQADIKEPFRQGEHALLHIDLLVPGVYDVSTRSMSDLQETAIDFAHVQALLFEETGSDEVFRYQAEIVNYSEPRITLKVPTSEPGKKYRLVILANADPQTIPVGTSKEAALSNFTFGLSGTWNASSANPRSFPMWGEYGQTFSITADRDLEILLHRAMARVDVGIRFAFNQPGGTLDDTQTVQGLDNFKIKEVYVYRTKNLAYAASSVSRMMSNEVIVPNIPAAAQFNTGSGAGVMSIETSEHDPLVYTLAGGSDSYLREIYIPESLAVTPSSTFDDVPCLVIGGYYGEGNTTDVTYYRADFATYSNGTLTAYKSILRNHRYVFDILSIQGPGFTDPYDALHSLRSDLLLDVVEWNEVALNQYVQGSYFFRIENRDLFLNARSDSGSGFASETISYQTNLNPNPVEKPFTYKWQSSDNQVSDYFDVSFDYAAGTITFTAKQNNVSAGAVPLSDVLILTIENFQLSIRVNQGAFITAYYMDCSTVEVFGVCREGTPLNASHYITMQVYSPNLLAGESYDIRTVEKNGIFYQAQGTFGTPSSVDARGYVYDMRLNGTGTPVNEGSGDVLLSFDATIVSSSTTGETCLARIIVGFRTKKILTIGANAIYKFGYVLENASGSRSFVDAAVNFGNASNSVVTMETNPQGFAFTIQVITNGEGMSVEVINYNGLLNALNTFKPDIILTGQAINFLPQSETSNRQTIKLLASFVEQGGVFLMFNEYYPNAASISAMVSEVLETSTSGRNNALVLPNLVFDLPGGTAYENDPVLNGPFGDLRGLTWGSDGTALYTLTGLPESQLTVYSRHNGEVCMFRHKTKPFLFIGDGGFISNNRNYIGGAHSSNDYFPFAIDAQFRPIPRTAFSGGKTVYNSQIFGNIMRWAVETSEVSGIRYPETGNKFPVTP